MAQALPSPSGCSAPSSESPSQGILGQPDRRNLAGPETLTFLSVEPLVARGSRRRLFSQSGLFMRLRPLQIILWIAATAAVATFSAVRWWPATDDTPQQQLQPSRLPSRLRTAKAASARLPNSAENSCWCSSALQAARMSVRRRSPKSRRSWMILDLTQNRCSRFSFRSIPNGTSVWGLLTTQRPFHPAILGLAGSEEETKSAAARFKIFYEREADTSSPDGYTMAHSPGLYLISPDGEWLRQFTYGTSAAEILSDLQSRL